VKDAHRREGTPVCACVRLSVSYALAAGRGRDALADNADVR
jgi:hypothetical protein